jgi:proline iminopeptidase
VLDVGSARLFTETVGDGPEVVVLLHGGPGASHDYLRPQLDALAAPGRRRLFYYDQRGGGRSPLAPGRPWGTAADHVADLESVRAHLGVDRMMLVGHSWGALLALLYAAEHARQVSRMVLISPAPAKADERDEGLRRFAAASARPEVAALRARLPNDKRGRFAVAVAGWFADPRRAVELTPFVVRQAAEETVWRSLGAYDVRPRVAQLALRALVIHGTADPIPVQSARRTAFAINAEYLELEGVGHVPYIEARERLLDAVRRFLD